MTFALFRLPDPVRDRVTAFVPALHIRVQLSQVHRVSADDQLDQLPLPLRDFLQENLQHQEASVVQDNGHNLSIGATVPDFNERNRA